MAAQDPKNASDDLGAQAVALAEQLGRIAGTVEGTAEAWLQRQQLTEQLARVRDGASRMLDSLTTAVGRGPKKSKAKTTRAAKPAARRAADPARAPGKRRRKPAPSSRGVKKSNEAIPKMRTAAAVRRRRKSYA
jgi:hypothetical protein